MNYKKKITFIIAIIFCFISVNNYTNSNKIKSIHLLLKKINSLAPDLVFHGAEKTLHKITETIEKKEKGIFLRFGDGELFTANGKTRSKYQKWEKLLEMELREALALDGENVMKAIPLHNKKLGTIEPGMFIGNHEHTLKYCILFLELLKPFWGKIRNAYSHPALHYFAIYRQREFVQFCKLIKKHKCIFVGNKDIPLNIVKTLFGKKCKFVPTPPKNAYDKIKRIEKECLEKATNNNNEYTIIVTAMGIGSKALQKRIWKKLDNVFLLDLGSLIDYFCGWKTRQWIEDTKLDRKKILRMLKN